MANIQQANQLKLSQTAFLLCDIQEKFKAAIDHFDEIVEVAKRLVKITNLINKLNIKNI